MSPKVSIITTVYSHPEYLNECIDSVLNQTLTDWELILLEDNSSDPRVKQIMESYTDPRIIKHYENTSDAERYRTARYATLINIGVSKYSTGKYITYLVDDDFYYPDRLKTLVDFMEEYPMVNVAYHPLDNIDMLGNRGDIRGVKGLLDGRSPDTQAMNYVDHNQVIHKRELFFEVGGWDDSPNVWGGADAYFWKKLTDSGHIFFPVGSNDRPLAAKRFHQNNVQTKIAENRFFPDNQKPESYCIEN